MDIINIYDKLKASYKNYLSSFVTIKDKREIREFGEYRTKRLVMEAWNKFGFDK